MKLFPNKNITVELKDDRGTTLNELSRNTKLTDTLASDYTDKEFIGQVNDCGFKIISSEIGRGAFCIFIGEFQDSIGTIEIRIHNAFKVLLSIIMLMPIIACGISVLIQESEEVIGIFILTIIVLLVIRFVFIELSFRFISKTGLNKLARITGIRQLN